MKVPAFKYFLQRTIGLLFLTAICFPVASQGTKHLDDKLEWWGEARFGMFIHWGLYAQDGCFYKGQDGKTEHMMRHLQIPLAEYAKIADDFNPVHFDADQWVAIAKKAGMKYVVFTAKHHDGFAMFNSPSSGYDVVSKTPFGRDPVQELAAACKAQGLKFGVYYSLGRDWEDPDAYTENGRRSNTWDYPDESKKDFSKYMERKVKPQLRELLTQYGQIDIVWFDTPENISKNQSAELVDLILSIQPQCIINSRVGNKMGDYGVSEQEIPEHGNVMPWETCMTMNNHWGYKKTDHKWKQSDLLIKNLIDIASKGGNFLLNVGPDNLGQIPAPSVERLEEIGAWMGKYGESIYGTKAGPVQNVDWCRSTMKTKKSKTKVYLHVFDWPNDGEISFPASNPMVRAYRLENRKDKLKYRKEGESYFIKVPKEPLNSVAGVVVIEVKGKPGISIEKADGEIDKDKFY
jgi:alpha-L-fucosidase